MNPLAFATFLAHSLRLTLESTDADFLGGIRPEWLTLSLTMLGFRKEAARYGPWF